MSQLIRIEIVSAEQQLLSADIKQAFVSGVLGDMEILPGHTPLITMLKPGDIVTRDAEDREHVFYVSGGLLEVQPYIVTVLADTAIRAEEIDLAAAEEVKKHAEERLAAKGDIDYAAAAAELARAVAQIRAAQKLRKDLGL